MLYEEKNQCIRERVESLDMPEEKRILRVYFVKQFLSRILTFKKMSFFY